MDQRDVRRRVAAGERGTLRELWERAAGSIPPPDDAGFRADADKARDALPVDGEVVDCNAALPARLVRHAWGTVQATKVDAFHQRLDRLVLKLSDILKADYERSDARRDVSQLKASVGTAFGDAFDFTAMSQVLATSGPADTFPDSRRKRIYHLLAALTSRAFLPEPGAPLRSMGSASRDSPG